MPTQSVRPPWMAEVQILHGANICPGPIYSVFCTQRTLSYGLRNIVNEEDSNAVECDHADFDPQLD